MLWTKIMIIIHCWYGKLILTQEEAVEAYDTVVIKFEGVNVVINFDITRYDVEKIMKSNNLLSSEQAICFCFLFS